MSNNPTELTKADLDNFLKYCEEYEPNYAMEEFYMIGNCLYRETWSGVEVMHKDSELAKQYLNDNKNLPRVATIEDFGK